MIYFKDNTIVIFNSLINNILTVVGKVYEEHGYDMWVTAGVDGAHMPTSLHYQGRAMDFRTSHIPAITQASILSKCKMRLPGHDVIMEKDHLHVEYDPQPVVAKKEATRVLGRVSQKNSV